MENTENKEIKSYEKEGFVGGVVGQIVGLMVGVGVAVLVLIFVGTLGGQTYNLTEDEINAISNETVRNSIQDGVVSGFEALAQTGNYLPLIVLAVVIFLILGLVLGMGALGGNGGGSGRAL